MNAPPRTVALVTGADRGRGREIARRLAERGQHVLLGASGAEPGTAAALELSAEGLDVRPLLLDPADPADVAAAADAVASGYGRLDVLVNSAGVTGDRAFDELDEDELRRSLEVNVLGTFRVTRALLPLLLRSPAGRVVNASAGPGAARTPAADVSRAALDVLTLEYAKALRGTHVKVNAVAPDRPDVAAVAVRLATLDAAGPTGEIHG
jgi:NAD(P)-dependent dehydrogenase (short-subunit alcohol dehydrogenase family)